MKKIANVIYQKLARALLIFTNTADQKASLFFLNKSFSFQFILNLFLIFWITGMIIVGFNPLKLFWAETIFPIPPQERRTQLNIFVPDIDNANTLKPISKLILETTDPLFTVLFMAHTISNPKIDSLGTTLKTKASSLQELPLLGHAITRVWLTDDKTMLININENILTFEMKSYIQKSKRKNTDEAYYLNLFFQALSASILNTKKDIKLLMYRIDGIKKNIHGMSFDLEQTLTQETFLKK